MKPAALGLPLLVVAQPDLGTINHTLLTVGAARQAGLTVTGIVTNGLKSETAGLAEETSPAEISRFGRVPILGTLPWVQPAQPAGGWSAAGTEATAGDIVYRVAAVEAQFLDLPRLWTENTDIGREMLG